jgi:DNA-binding CsgD family transcriptional regulator
MTTKNLRDILTPRQFVLATLVASGRNNRLCEAEMGISELSVKHRLKEVFDRAGVWSDLELACRYAWEWKAGLYPDAPHPLTGQERFVRRKGVSANPRGINGWTKIRRGGLLVHGQSAAVSVCDNASHSFINDSSSLRSDCSS